MFKLALRNLWRRRTRFLLIISVAALSVSLPTATAIFRDSIFNDLNYTNSPTAEAVDYIIEENISFYNDQTDEQIKSENDYFGRQREEFLDNLHDTVYINEALLNDLSQSENIELIAGVLENTSNKFQIIKTTNGEERQLEWGTNPGGEFNVSHTEHESFNEYLIISGNPPSAADEIILDAAEAANEDIAIGDTVRLESHSTDLYPDEEKLAKEFKVVGFAEVKAEGKLTKFIEESVVINVFHIDGLRQLLNYPPDKLDIIKIKFVSDDLTDYETYVEDVELALPEHAELGYIFGYEQVIPNRALFGQLSDLQAAVDSYVGLAIFISIFVIFNIFNAVLKQQAKETALIRAVGFTRFAIFRLVTIESLILAFLAVLSGLVVGTGLGYLLVELSPGLLEFASVEINLELRWQTFIWPTCFGLLTILAAGLWPAIRASRLKPLEALTATDQPAKLSKRRVIIGLVLLAIAGIITTLFVISLKSGEADLLLSVNRLLLIGSLLVIAALILLPVGVRLCITAISRLLRPIIGNNSALVLGNINRQLGQMSTNISALVVCMVLIIISTVLLHSLTISFKNDLKTVFAYDYYTWTSSASDITTLKQMESLRSGERLSNLNIIDGQIRWSYTTMIVVSEDEEEAVLLMAADIKDSDTAYAPGIPNDNWQGKGINGSELDNLKRGEIIVSESLAEKNNWQLGQSVNLAYIGIDNKTDNEHEYVIGGTAGDRDEWGFIILDRDYFLEHADNETAVSRSWIAFNAREEASTEEVYEATEEILAEDSFSPASFGQEGLQEDADKLYLESLGQISKTAIPALIIVLWGLASALSLAVLERGREIGILRALGFSRRQIQTTITAEAVTTVFLAVSIANLIGILLAWGIYETLIPVLVADVLENTDNAVFSIPWGVLFLYLGVNLILAVIASLWPAIRAGRLDIVESITKP